MTTEPTITLSFFNELQKLNTELLGQAQDAFGFFGTKTRYAVGYSDPVLREEVQKKLDHAVGLLGVAHVMAIFEEKLPENYWGLLLSDAELVKRIKAYKHIRNCAANGFTGRRPSGEKDEFDQVMSGDNPIEGIKSFDDDEIVFVEGVGNHACTFLRRMAEKALVEAHRRLP